MNAARPGLPGLALVLALWLPAQTAFGATEAQAVQSSGKPAMSIAPMKPNGSDVVVSFGIDGSPQAGVALSIVLGFDHLADPAGASVRLGVDGGLTLLSPSTFELPAGPASSRTVQVIPAAGLGYLHVFTTQHGATSAISVPVQAGQGPDAPPSDIQPMQTPGGEKILPMKVK
jgi:hypothetical protein